MNSDWFFVDLQGFKTINNEFIVKEFAFSTEECTQLFLIKPPYTFSTLTECEKRQVRWVERCKKIFWSEGFVDFLEFKRLAVRYLTDKTIFVKGMEKIKWVKDLCNNCTVINLEEKGSPNLKSLHSKYCENNEYNCTYHKKDCALKNVMCIKKWYFDNASLYSLSI